MKNLVLILLATVVISCKQTSDTKAEDETAKEEVITTKKEDTLATMPVELDGGIGDGAISLERQLTQNVEKAHKKEAFLEKTAISFDIVVRFGNSTVLDGKITQLTNSTKIRIDKKDGTKLIYNGEKVMLYPADAKYSNARFDIFTWSYFFAMPYKLNDPGVVMEVKKDRSLDNEIYTSAKLSFNKGTGDAPDDWYIIYVNPKNHVLTAAAYIVTFGPNNTVAKAERDPHMIIYKDYAMVNDIPISTQWDFYEWKDGEGKNKKLGEAMLTNVGFIENAASLFEEPDDYKEVTLN
ncbi:DUF6503 family protein [Aquimarina brevivitae]|uniref:Outer membrane lipoprotein-sorting protein n=1 Tax=Aquimarina brevivitae TaxID=323412 RepID=A0A4Q7P1C9_9FLAO|nr:DUF6503 family protein [Aquimarina brevivitae]RZS93118.1 hypothetical protein EV197_1688 [Aquimarina brevivitae]